MEEKHKECIKQKEKSEKYINKFNIEKIKAIMKNIEEKSLNEEFQNKGINQYKNLSYQLAKAKDSNNFGLEQEIKSKMVKCSIDYKLTDSQMSNASIEGTLEYSNEKIVNKAISDEIREKEEARVKMNAEIYSFLREQAIKELENSNILNNIDPVVKNSDVSIGAEIEERERLISKKIEEIAKFCEMSPEQRGLQELKDRGILPKEATLDSLTPQQKMDFRYAYRDAAYEYIPKYKKVVQEKGTQTIYAEYLKYKANLEDKSKSISFDEFIVAKYNSVTEEKEELVGRKK